MVRDTIDTFKLAASYTIGSHILPGKPISDISQKLQSKIQLKITTCDQIIEGVKQNQYDLGLIETPIFDSSLIYKEWLEDELVICSKTPIPKIIDENELRKYRLIARKENSPTRKVITNFLESIGLSHYNFKSITKVDNATAIIQSIKWSKPNRENPSVAIVSKIAIEDELKKEELHISLIKNHPLIRKFYLIYNPKSYNTIDIDEIIKLLQNYR